MGNSGVYYSSDSAVLLSVYDTLLRVDDDCAAICEREEHPRDSVVEGAIDHDAVWSSRWTI